MRRRKINRNQTFHFLSEIFSLKRLDWYFPNHLITIDGF